MPRRALVTPPPSHPTPDAFIPNIVNAATFIQFSLCHWRYVTSYKLHCSTCFNVPGWMHEPKYDSCRSLWGGGHWTWLSQNLLASAHWRRHLCRTGARASLNFQLFNFQASPEPHKLWHLTQCGCISSKITLLDSCPPFTPNPGDATVCATKQWSVNSSIWFCIKPVDMTLWRTHKGDRFQILQLKIKTSTTSTKGTIGPGRRLLAYLLAYVITGWVSEWVSE